VQPITHTVIGAALLSLTLVAAAQKPIAYPSKGQTEKQQGKDEGECYTWAKKSTGIDPAALAATPPPQSDSTVGGGERTRGAARGALGGAAIGAIGGDTGKGAGVGAVVGTMAGGRQARQNRDARNQQAQGAHQEALNTYYRGYGACMTGRGYTVSQ
jgi:hypothetical protein